METEHPTSSTQGETRDPLQELQGQIIMLSEVCTLLLVTHPQREELKQVITKNIEGDPNIPLVLGMQNAQQMLTVMLGNKEHALKMT